MHFSRDIPTVSAKSDNEIHKSDRAIEGTIRSSGDRDNFEALSAFDVLVSLSNFGETGDFVIFGEIGDFINFGEIGDFSDLDLVGLAWATMPPIG